jgi:hypothetical protein
MALFCGLRRYTICILAIFIASAIAKIQKPGPFAAKYIRMPDNTDSDYVEYH